MVTNQAGKIDEEILKICIVYERCYNNDFISVRSTTQGRGYGGGGGEWYRVGSA